MSKNQTNRTSGSLEISKQAEENLIFTAEGKITRIRSMLILFNIIIYYGFLDKQTGIPGLAMAITVLASLYTLFIETVKPYKKYPIFLAGSFTAVSDCLLIMLWILATGSYYSPFFVVWYISIFAVAFRFSAKTTLISSVLYSLCYAGQLYYTDHFLFFTYLPEISVRIMYILLSGILGSFITRENLSHALQSLELEELSRQVKDVNDNLLVQTTLYENMLHAQSELGEGVVIIKDDKLVYINDAMCSLFGKTAQDFLSVKSAIDLVAPEVREEARERTSKRLNGQLTDHYNESILEVNEGQKIHIGYSSKVFVMNGEKHLFYVVRNITERKKQETELEEYNRRIVNILESVKDGFFAIDNQWNITYWNKEAECILGMPRHEVIGNNLWEVFPDCASLKFYPEYTRALNEQVSVHFEEFYDRLSIWFSVSAYPSGEGLSVYFKDITQNRNFLSAIEEKNRRLREIAWMQSHVIRAPLARIMGLIDLLKNHPSDEEQNKEVLNYILITAAELDKIIRDIIEKTEQVNNPTTNYEESTGTDH